MTGTAHTFTKQERMTSRKLIERLFIGGGGRSMSVFPLRAVYMLTGRESGAAGVQVLISVSKRHFKRAVRRNRVKRQIREAYRLNKDILAPCIDRHPDKTLALALIWQADELHDSRDVRTSVRALLHRIAEKI